MRWLAFWVTAAIWGQTFEATPTVVRQGEVMRLRAPAVALSARLRERTVKLFVEPDGTVSGLMPVGVLDKPGAYTLEFAGQGGAVLGSVAVTVRDAHYPAQNVVLGKAVTELKPSPGEMETAEAFRKAVTGVRHWTEPFGVPVPGCRTSLFGVRRLQNGKPTGNFHGGVDQRGAAGTPIRAAAAGMVRIVQPWAIHGNTVAIDHGQGVGTMYLHMSKFAVAEGATVKGGDVIGYVGTTGRSTAPHLHWSLYVNGVPVNPAQWVNLQGCEAATKAKKQQSRHSNDAESDKRFENDRHGGSGITGHRAYLFSRS